MALINCAECGKEISDQAKACPHCGNPAKSQPLMTKELGAEGVVFAILFLTGMLGLLGIFPVPFIIALLLFLFGGCLLLVKLLK